MASWGVSMLSKQVLVRLPEDIATRFAQLVPTRKRASYLVNLLRRELDRENSELEKAAQHLTQLESKDTALLAEDETWLNAPLHHDTDD